MDSRLNADDDKKHGGKVMGGVEASGACKVLSTSGKAV